MLNSPSSPSDEYPGEEDIPQVPRATELLMKLRNRETKVSWMLLVPCLINLGMAAGYLVIDGAKAMPQVAIWLATAVLFFVGERWDRQRRREQIVFELLSELVAENNRLRRLVPGEGKKG